MEQSTPANDAGQALEAQIRECFGRVVYSTKTHEKCADLYTSKHQLVKVTQIILSALTTAGLVTVLIGEPSVSHTATVVSSVISALLLILSAYAKDIDLGQQAEKHKKTASELWSVRESYLSILTDLRDGDIDLKSARTLRDDLQGKLTTIYASAPRTNAKAYGIASDGLKKNEEMTFSDDEIDQFLPAFLRRSAGESKKQT